MERRKRPSKTQVQFGRIQPGLHVQDLGAQIRPILRPAFVACVAHQICVVWLTANTTWQWHVWAWISMVFLTAIFSVDT